MSDKRRIRFFSGKLVDEQGSLKEIPFHKTATITSAACATAVNLLPDSEVPEGYFIVTVFGVMKKA